MPNARRTTPRRTTLVAAAVIALGVVALAALIAPALRPAERSGAPAAPGPVDVGFAQSMSLHHQQAIGMALLMLDERPTPLAALARGIATAQLVELGEMRGWLRLWERPLIAEKQGMDWMRLGSRPLDEDLLQYLLDCQRSPTGMSGLATDAEVNRLRQLEGRARDEHFLRLMLAHHEGGIPMARFAAEEARIPVVRELAARIILDQSKEVHRIRRTLVAMSATD